MTKKSEHSVNFILFGLIFYINILVDSKIICQQRLNCGKFEWLKFPFSVYFEQITKNGSLNKWIEIILVHLF